jgi:hypothetical protein
VTLPWLSYFYVYTSCFGIHRALCGVPERNGCYESGVRDEVWSKHTCVSNLARRDKVWRLILFTIQIALGFITNLQHCNRQNKVCIKKLDLRGYDAPGLFTKREHYLLGLENLQTSAPPLHSGTATHERATWSGLRPVHWYGTCERILLVQHHRPSPEGFEPGWAGWKPPEPNHWGNTSFVVCIERKGIIRLVPLQNAIILNMPAQYGFPVRHHVTNCIP